MITGKTITKESFFDMLDSQYQNYIVFFVDDSGGTLTDESTMADAVNLELPSGNGYARKTLLSNSFSYSNGNIQTSTDELQWNFTGNISFTHLCYAVQATLSNGDSTGKLERIVAANGGNSLSFVDGESYILPSFIILLNSTV